MGNRAKRNGEIEADTSISYNEWLEAIQEAEGTHPHDAKYTKDNGWYTMEEVRQQFKAAGLPSGDHYVRDKLKMLKREGKVVSESGTRTNESGLRRANHFYKIKKKGGLIGG